MMKKEDNIYTRILLWAYDKQETGFTWPELTNYFKLNTSQENWVKKIFLTTSDSDRKFFEILRNDAAITPNVYYYSLNEKGMSAAISYGNLKKAQKDSQYAIWFAGISALLAAMGLFFTIKQTIISEYLAMPERFDQAMAVKSSIEFCKTYPESGKSGLFNPPDWKPMSCNEVFQKYGNN